MVQTIELEPSKHGGLSSRPTPTRIVHEDSTGTRPLSTTDAAEPGRLSGQWVPLGVAEGYPPVYVEGAKSVPRQTTPTVAAALERYMLSKSHCQPSTLGNDRSVLNRFARRVGADRQVGYLTVEQVTRAVLAEADSQLPSSFNKVRGRVGQFLAYTRENGWTKVDLLREIKSRKVPQVERRKLPGADLVRMPDLVADSRDRAVIAFASNTLLRAGEIVILRVQDVTLTQSELHIYRPKTQTTDVLTLTPALDRELRRWFMAYSEEIGRPIEADDYLFPARTANKFSGDFRGGEPQPFQPRDLLPKRPMTHPARVVQRALREMGLTPQQIKGEGIHLLRRSAARAFYDYALAEGHEAAIRAVQAFLGHKNTVTTEHYLGLNADREVRNRILQQDFLPYVSNVTGIRRAS